MAKTSHSMLARTSKLMAFGRNAIVPPRPCDLATRRARTTREPRSPAEFLTRPLFAEQATSVQLSNGGQTKMEVELVLKVYVEIALVSHCVVDF